MQYKNVVLLNTTIGSFMALLDSNIVLISLPTIIDKLPGTSTVEGLWIIMGYTLVTGTLLLTIGRLADLYGRVKLYNLGFAIFTAGSALCSLSPNGLSLVLFRLVQGVGGGLIFANNAAILTDAFPATERGRAIGINQVAGVSGGVIGLVAGGFLTQLLGWQSIFWINIPVGIFATSWAYLRLKELGPPLRGEKLDLVGNVLFAAGLTVALLGLTLGSLNGFPALDAAMMAVGAACIVAFIFVELHTPYPMMDLGLFENRLFSAGVFCNLLASISRGGVVLVLVFYFQGALHLDPLTAGEYLIPFSLAFVSFGPLSGWLSDRYGARGFSTGGLVISAVAFGWFAILPAGVSYSIFVLPMVLAGVGGGMFFAPNVASIMNAVPVARRGVASGISSTLFNVGFLISLGVSFTFLATAMPLSVLQAIFAGLPVPNGLLDVGLFMGAFHEIFIFTMVISLIAAVPSALRGPHATSPKSAAAKGISPPGPME